METIPVRKINTSQKELNFSGGFSIRAVEDLLAGNDLVQDLHRHSFFNILALEKGAGEHCIDFTPYTVSDHAVFFMRPGQVHKLRLKAGSKGYLLQFSEEFYSPQNNSAGKLWRKVSNKNLCRMDAARFKKLHAVLTYIFQEHSDKQEGYQEIIKANLSIFFMELVRQSKNPEAPATNISIYQQERLEEFLELLENYLATQKQVAWYADKLNLSAYQLNAITKAMLGKTCSEIINEHSILEAKRYLLATPNQVKEIAYHLGYEDVSYFIRFFRKQTGHSPEVFRQNFK